MNSQIPIHIKRDIIEKSKKDTIRSVTSQRHCQSFLPQELYEVLVYNVKPYENMSKNSENYFHIVSGISSFNNYTEDIYWYINKLLLYLEFYQRIMDMKQFNLYNQRIIQSSYQNEFHICVPGLSEERQLLHIDDELMIYQVDGSNHTLSKIKFIGQEYISVSVNSKFKKKFEPTQKYHIEFFYFDWEIRNLNHILNKIHDENLIPMLFPVEQSLDEKKKPQIEWINPNIKNNPEQQQAVMNILYKTAYPAPYILFGPPGTGKTSTLVEAICQIIKNSTTNRVLICTPSNATADEVAMRLCEQSVNHKIIYRMFCKSKDVDTVNDNIKLFSNVADRGVVFVSKEVLLRKRIVITTLLTCMRLYRYKLREDYFSHVFCDEIGQTTELQALIPLALVSGKDSNNNNKFCAQIVMAGDHLQLGPVVSSRLAKPLLGKSILERLIQWGPYKKSKNTNKYNPTYITKLIRNYRSHPAILNLPNNLFYDGELIAVGGNNVKRGENWSGLQKRKFPIIFHAVKGQEQRQKNSPSICNYSEIRVVTKYVKRLINTKLGEKIVTEHDIGIITPYKLQKNKIQKALEEQKINDIAVGTVEVFQGQERDIIIISLVRTKLYMHNGCIHVGFLSDPKRFNVAITRARALLIVVGEPEILQHDETWRVFLQYCVDNKCCTGYKFKLHQHVSKSKIHKLIAKKHVVDQPEVSNSYDPIINVVSDNEIETVKFEIDKDRRRRLPYGPLPSNFSDSIKKNSTFGLNINSQNEFYLKLENQCKNKQYPTECDDKVRDFLSENSYDNNDDDENNDCESNSDTYYSASDNCFSRSRTDTISARSENTQNTDEDSFEEKLKERMMTLTLNNIF